jgi:hypothetical protein
MLSGRHDGWLVGFFSLPNLFLFTAVWRVDETGCCFLSLDFVAMLGQGKGMDGIGSSSKV